MATIVQPIQALDPDDALIIIAFSSTGAASPIAGQYLINHLSMPLVGEVVCSAYEGIVHVQDGLPTSPIRIHGGDVACELDGPCQRTYVVTSEIPIHDEVQAEVAEAVMAWGKNARLILCLDAIAKEDRDKDPKVFTVANNEAAGKRIKTARADPLASALMTGINAHLLSGEAPCAALVGEALADHPDGRAAAGLVMAMDPLIPQIKIDAEPLIRDARALEAHIQAAMMEAERSQSKRTPHSFI